MEIDSNWLFDFFKDDLLKKKMFGGEAYYFLGKFVFLIMNSPGDRKYKDKVSDHDIWNGVLFPTEREFQKGMIKDHPEIFPHFILGKWLYLPFATDDFDNIFEGILRQIRARDDRWGIWPKEKTRRAISKDKIVNFGKGSMAELKLIGVTKFGEFKKLGWIKIYQRVIKNNPKRLHLLFAYALYGAEKRKDWRSLTEKEKKTVKIIHENIKLKLKKKN